MTKPKKAVTPKKLKSAQVSSDSPKKPLFKATVKVLGRLFTAEGESIREALSNLQPGNVKGVGVLTVEKDGVKREKILPAGIVFRLFTGSRTMREIGLKQATLIFGDL